MRFKLTWERIVDGIGKERFKRIKDRPVPDQSQLTSSLSKSVMPLSRCVTAQSSRAYLQLKSYRHCLIKVSISPQSRAIIGYWVHKDNFIIEAIRGVDKNRQSQRVIRRQARVKSTHGISLTCLQRFEASTIICTSLRTSTAEKSWVMRCMNVSAAS